jgi:hypothetical protein
MKTVWNILSILAVANLLAMVAFAGWLKSGDRLDAARLMKIRDMLRETRAQQADREASEASMAAEARAAGPAEAVIPIAASELLEQRLSGDAIDQQRLERLRREVSDLQQTLRRERAILDEQRDQFKAERDEFEERLARLEELKGSQQFKKSLGTLEALKPTEAKAVLLEMLGAGPGAAPQDTAPDSVGSQSAATPPQETTDRYEQVVAYLDAMQDRVRAKLMTEIATDNPALAADLLDRLRTHGLAARVPETPPG